MATDQMSLLRWAISKQGSSTARELHRMDMLFANPPVRFLANADDEPDAEEEMQDEELEALEDDRAYAEDEPDPLNPVLAFAWDDCIAEDGPLDEAADEEE